MEPTSSAAPSPVPVPTGRIAYQGEPGANSDIACREMFPSLEPLPRQTFEDAFDAVETGQADLAMIPVENSLAGRVADIHHLLPVSQLHIVGEHFLPIHFQLMALPGTTLDQIRTVRSHIHAMGQCRRIIRENRWSPAIADDTAGAAREVGELGDPSVAALAPRLAADLYGLEILAENVEDAHHNTTRFLVLAREAAEQPLDDGPMITSIVFRVRNVPAALYKAMGGFATNGVNMTKLESYQLGGTFFATQFYADIEGHPKQTPVVLALEELEFFSVHLRVLGTYPASPFRAAIAEPAENRELRPVRKP
ncbi:MAG TPA: prephenate dehydratase [Kineosporiaceae bacterium]|nr:prephenate dehydratase [Kineosporiaceae bacterium]